MNNCSMCPFFCKKKDDLFTHLVKRHRNEPNFIVHCSVRGCGATFTKIESFRSHLSRKHAGEHDFDESQEICSEYGEGDNFHSDTEMDFDRDILGENDLSRKINEAQFILKLKAQHSLSQTAIEEILLATKVLISERCDLAKRKLLDVIPEDIIHGVDLKHVFEDHTFSELDTEFMQEKFFKSHLGYIKPQSVKLGEMNMQKKVKGKYRFVQTDILGYFVPFLEQLEKLLSMPEVQECLATERRKTAEFSDIYDGLYFQKDFFQNKPNLLLFSLYHDDFEIVNPIGSHKKKHKLSVFYWNLLSLAPEVRFKVQATQLLAVAHTRHLKKFGMASLLQDFVNGLQCLHTGHQFLINTREKTYFGALYCVLADTPAAQLLGGFKEGVGMADKPCRTCEVSHTELDISRFGNQFIMRNETEHVDRCEIITALRGETKKYWSRMYGITSKSFLCDVPQFEVTKCILHDPMHVLLEGIVKMVLQLTLFNFIEKKNYFSLSYLNNAIKHFNYDDLEKADKPQELEKKSLDIKATFPMTAAETKNFMVLLPFMIGEKVPDTDKIWENYLRILRITLIVISPVASNESIDTLHQLIASHNHCFGELFPEVKFTPKLHYLTHLPMQIQMFGPGRNHWCFRLEAKHALFKNRKWKNFKSLAKSVSFYHQRWMCLQQSEASQVYLYKGDQVKDGHMVEINDVSQIMVDRFAQNEENSPSEVFCSTSVNIKGIEYAPGDVLLLKIEEGVPQFGIIENIYVVNHAKYFELYATDIQEFSPHMNTFVCTKTDRVVDKSAIELTYLWPQKKHFVNENEVDGFSLIHMEEKDIFLMLPGKVGAVRKILTLLKKMKTDSLSLTETEKRDNVIDLMNSEQGQMTSPAEEKVEAIIYLDPLKESLDLQFPCGDGQKTSQQKEPQIIDPKNIPVFQISEPRFYVPLSQYVPTYSKPIAALLETGEIFKEWEKFIEETAYHVINVGNFESKGLYRDFGRLMHSKFPCIGHSAMKDPWGYFNKKLSQKVRHIRWKWNTRGRNQVNGTEEPQPKKKRYVDYVDLNDSTLMKPDEGHHAMDEELKKPMKEQDKALLFKAQRSTFKDRRSYINGLPNSSIKQICEKYPILAKSVFIEKEFFMIRDSVKKEEIVNNWEKMLNKLDNLFGEGKDEERKEEDVISCLNLLQDELKYNAKSKSIAPIISVCKANELTLHSRKNEAPHLKVIYNDDESINNIYVIAEGIHVEVGDKITEAITHLLYSYYVWDLSYPKQYQILGFLQHYVLEDRQNKFFMNANFLKFTKKYDS